MWDPDKSSFEILMEIAITTLVFSALLFLVGLASDPGMMKYSPFRQAGIVLGR